MLKAIRTRIKLGRATTAHPEGSPPARSDRYRGPPSVAADQCADQCRACVAACPTEALTAEEDNPPRLDLGRCIFCTDCVEACPQGAIRLGDEHQLAMPARDALVLEASASRDLGGAALALDDERAAVLSRSLKLRHVSAGGCRGCALEVAALTTIGWDLSRFGIALVTSPRHADGLLITGAVSENMRQALEATWAAIPAPKVAIAIGACAISGGLYRTHPECHEGVAGVSSIPIDLYIPGCPPHPLTILDGLLRLMGRMG